MDNEKTKNTHEIMCSVKDETEKIIKEIIEDGITTNNVDFLSKVVDINKDITEIEKEEEEMMYGNYRNYGRDDEMMYSGGRRRDSRGRYMESGSYGRRGVRGSGRGRYRGEEMMDEMAYHYGNYSEGREQYGADQETMESFKYMLKSFKDYYKHLKQEASSQQEVQMLEDVAREISEM